ncbi:MAG: ABC transporter ATP-binding protein [Bacteroidales bacterium]|nr:ABC transporter ATP-binding protein [Bacteroidales bacterium]
MNFSEITGENQPLKGKQEADKKNVAVLSGTSKQYKTGDTTITALQPSDVVFRENELTLVIGPSGSGKTTLLSLAGCVIYPTSGDVWVKGQHVNTLNPDELARLRLYNIGFVFQNFNLIAPLTALENVMQPLRMMKIPVKEARKKAQEALEMVQMGDRMKSLPKQLSGGQQQRVAIARALVGNPSLILCDEPTAALDAKSVSIVMHELKSLAKDGKSVAVVTHDTRLKQFADRIIYVHNGYVSETPPDEEIFN